MNGTNGNAAIVAIAKVALDFLMRDADKSSMTYRLLERVQEGFAAYDTGGFVTEPDTMEALAARTLAELAPAAPAPDWSNLPTGVDGLLPLAEMIRAAVIEDFSDGDTPDMRAVVVVQHGVAPSQAYYCPFCKAKLILLAAIRGGNIILAIKILRDWTGSSLLAAKDAVDSLR